MIFWVSIILLSLGTFIIICDWIGVYLSKNREGGFSYAPFIAGILYFFGILLLPIELPIPKLLAAFIVLCLDLTISVMLPMMIVDWFKSRTKEN
tara:strand:- start:466 stop:747 length:282 start_codon:yes stop_codon:yes gene_type:complete